MRYISLIGATLLCSAFGCKPPAADSSAASSNSGAKTPQSLCVLNDPENTWFFKSEEDANNDRNGQKFSTVRIFPKFSERVNYHLTLFQKGKNSWRVGNDKGSLWVGMNRCEEVSKNPKVGCLIHGPNSVWFFNSEDDANNNRNGQKFSNGFPDIFTYSGRALQLLVFKKGWNSWLVGNDKGSLWVGMNACEEYIPREPAQPDQREEEICKNPRACCNGMMHLPDGQAVPCGYGGTRF